MAEFIFIVDSKKIKIKSTEEPPKNVQNFTYTKTGQLIGFTKEKDFINWTKKQKLFEITQAAMKTVKLAHQKAGTLKSAQKNKIRNLQIIIVEVKNKRILKVLNELKIQPHEIKKIEKLHKTYDIIGGPIFDSVILYDKINYGGKWKYLTSGPYPNLKWIGFGDRTESAHVLPSTVLLLCQHSWWRGRRLWLYWSKSNLGWFNNRASAAYVYSLI